MLFLVLLILSLASAPLLPWWCSAVLPFTISFFAAQNEKKSFLSGFAAYALGWTLLALSKSLPNGGLLARRIAVLMQLPHWTLVLALTAVIGGLLGGMGALSGLLVRKAIANKQPLRR